MESQEKMKIILVRHAESEANAKGIHQGQRIDVGLSEKGKEQAKRVAKELKNEKIEAIYSSDLKRAMETAEAIAKFHKIKLIPDKRLREFDMGDFTPIDNAMETFHKHKKEESKRLGTETYKVKTPGGESEWDHYLRVKDFINEISKKHKGTIVVVSHGGSNKIVFGVIGHVPKDKMYFIPQDNTGVSLIELTDKGHKVHHINKIDHLEKKK